MSDEGGISPNGSMGGMGGNNVGGNVSRPVDDNLFVGTNIKKMCQAGEIDLIRALLVCNPDLNVILTMRDGLGEVLLENFGNMNESGSAQAVIDKVINMDISAPMAGQIVDLFLCLDHDGDLSCTDEEVKDLNAHNDDILTSVKKFQGAGIDVAAAGAQHERDIIEGDGTSNLPSLCADDRLGAISNGLVFYHQEFKDDSMVSSSGQDADREDVAERVNEFVKNINEDNGSIDFSVGSPITLTLVESDKQACKAIGRRMHGCFVKGTQIALSQKSQVAIEELRVGDTVMLSNGKKSKIVHMISGPEKKPVIQLDLVNGKTLSVTDTHPMLTEMGVVQAKNLTIGSRLLTKDGHWVTLSSISTKKYEDHVFNIELAGSHETDHLIYGNGIVTGDLHLQQKLQTKPNPGLQFSLSNQ